MGLAESFKNIEQHLIADAESVKARIEGDLPEVARFVQDASTNPVVLALSQAVHLPDAPEVLQGLAALITSADNALGAAKAQAAAPAPDAQPVTPTA